MDILVQTLNFQILFLIIHQSEYLKTKIYHPNISTRVGYYCLDKFKSYIWSPAFIIRQILLETSLLLSEPDEENNVLEPEIANIFKNDKKKFEKTAKEWTERYAY